MQVKSAETFILCTLADSVNFSCSGLLCSSYSTTPSGHLADAGLPSPTAPPRLPLATSSWVSRRLRGNKERKTEGSASGRAAASFFAGSADALAPFWLLAVL